MKNDLSKGVNRPFKDLDIRMRQRDIPVAPRLDNRAALHTESPAMKADKDAALFMEAMADVTPLTFNRAGRPARPARIMPWNGDDDDHSTLEKLQRLVRHGHGFIVSQTPEYMESANCRAGAEMLRRLHNGHYAIQDHVDLHGLRVPEAERELAHFIRCAVNKGYRAVLVVHGRGLTSPKEPVLKKKVFFWLTRGPLRKWVIALTSARSCDGGAGATYVLLRQHPMTKGRRKKVGQFID